MMKLTELLHRLHTPSKSSMSCCSMLAIFLNGIITLFDYYKDNTTQMEVSSFCGIQTSIKANLPENLDPVPEFLSSQVRIKYVKSHCGRVIISA